MPVLHQSTPGRFSATPASGGHKTRNRRCCRTIANCIQDAARSAGILPAFFSCVEASPCACSASVHPRPLRGHPRQRGTQERGITGGCAVSRSTREDGRPRGVIRVGGHRGPPLQSECMDIMKIRARLASSGQVGLPWFIQVFAVRRGRPLCLPFFRLPRGLSGWAATGGRPYNRTCRCIAMGGHATRVATPPAGNARIQNPKLRYCATCPPLAGVNRRQPIRGWSFEVGSPFLKSRRSHFPLALIHLCLQKPSPATMDGPYNPGAWMNNAADA